MERAGSGREVTRGRITASVAEQSWKPAWASWASKPCTCLKIQPSAPFLSPVWAANPESLLKNCQWLLLAPTGLVEERNPCILNSRIRGGSRRAKLQRIKAHAANLKGLTRILPAWTIKSKRRGNTWCKACLHYVKFVLQELSHKLKKLHFMFWILLTSFLCFTFLWHYKCVCFKPVIAADQILSWPCRSILGLLYKINRKSDSNPTNTIKNNWLSSMFPVSFGFSVSLWDGVGDFQYVCCSFKLASPIKRLLYHLAAFQCFLVVFKLKL